MKKMMKKLIPILLICAMLLTGCGGASKSDSSSTGSAPGFAGNGSSMNMEMDMGWVEDSIMVDTEESVTITQSSTNSGSNPLANAKIIYSADLEMETKEFDAASQALDRLVTSMGGYYESRQLNQGGSYRSMSCTIRVPAEQFSAFLVQAGEVAHMVNCYEHTDDISEIYYDNEARLTTQRTKLERLHELLEKATTMEDIIELETAISDTELQIEYLTGTLRKYDSLVNFSTVNLYLWEVYRLSTDEVPAQTFSQRFGAALITGLERGIDDLEDFIIRLARNWLGNLMFVAVVVVAVIILRRIYKKRRAAKAAKLEAAAAAKKQENDRQEP